MADDDERAAARNVIGIESMARGVQPVDLGFKFRKARILTLGEVRISN